MYKKQQTPLEQRRVGILEGAGRRQQRLYFKKLGPRT